MAAPIYSEVSWSIALQIEMQPGGSTRPETRVRVSRALARSYRQTDLQGPGIDPRKQPVHYAASSVAIETNHRIPICHRGCKFIQIRTQAINIRQGPTVGVSAHGPDTKRHSSERPELLWNPQHST